MSIAEKLTTIAENQEKVFEAGKNEVLRELKEAQKGVASGEIIAITDISPIEHNLGVKLSSKNLIPYPYADTTKTMNGITFTDNGDGSITINGTAEITSSFYFTKESYGTNEIGYLFEDGETYFISLDKNISGVTIVLVSYTYDGVVNYFYSGKSFTVDKSKYKYSFIRLQINGGTTLENETLYPMIEKGTKATAYTPYVDDVSQATLSATGKNLIPYPYADTTKTMNGVTFTDNGDGSITIKGKKEDTSKSSYFILSRGIDFGATSFGDGSDWSKTSYTNGIYTIGKGMYYNSNGKVLSINIPNNLEIDETVYPQLEVGESATPYEPYIQPTSYTPNADGTVEGVKSIYPTTTLMADTQGVLIDAEYIRDLNGVVDELTDAIISLGGDI